MLFANILIDTVISKIQIFVTSHFSTLYTLLFLTGPISQLKLVLIHTSLCLFAFTVNKIKKPKPSSPMPTTKKTKPQPTARKSKEESTNTDATTELIKKVKHKFMTVYYILSRHVYQIIMGAAFLLVLVIIVLCLCRYDIVASDSVSPCYI